MEVLLLTDGAGGGDRVGATEQLADGGEEPDGVEDTELDEVAVVEFMLDALGVSCGERACVTEHDALPDAELVEDAVCGGEQAVKRRRAACLLARDSTLSGT